MTGAALLIAAVAGVGILHTLVPDHWAPIALLARQEGWTKSQLTRAAALAGVGHVTSTLLIAVVVWLLGGAIALKLGNAVNLLSGIALIGFGAWFAFSSLLEIRHHGQNEPRAHAHHDLDSLSITEAVALAAPVHEHQQRRSFRTALLLIVGSSPMVEGIPAFFAAAKFGIQQLAIMATVFGVCTIATYVVLCFLAVSGLERIALGKFERYGEVISGAFIAVIGIAFLFLR